MGVGTTLAKQIEQRKEKQKTGTGFNEDFARIQLRLGPKEQDLRRDVWFFKVEHVRDLSPDQRKALNAHFDRLVYRAGLQALKKLTPAAAIGDLLRALALEKPKTRGGRPRK